MTQLSLPLLAGLEIIFYAWGIWRIWRSNPERKSGFLLTLLLAIPLLGRGLVLFQMLQGARQTATFWETYIALGIAIALWLLLVNFRGRNVLRASVAAWPWPLLVIGLAALHPRLPEIIWERGNYILPREALPALGAFGGWLFLGLSMTLFALGEARRLHQPMHRARFTYWGVILLLFALDGWMTFVWAMPGFHPARLGMVWVVIYLFTHHRVRALREILRVVLIYLSTILLIGMLYLVTTLVTERFLGNRPNYNPLWSGSLIALGLALLFTPLLNQVQRVINRWLRAERPDVSRIVQLYSQNISHILEMQRLAQVTVALIMETVGLQHGFLFLVEKINENGTTRYRLRAVRHPAERPIKPLELPENHPLTDFLLRGQPLLQYDVDFLPEFRGLSSFEREWLQALQTEVYVPVFSKGNWIGLFAFGPRLNAQPFSEQDLALLTALGQQTAVALENAKLVEDLVRLNRELRQTTHALEKAQREVERLDRTRADFISIASHELRTPLTVIRGYVEMLLEKEDLDPDVRTFLKSMHESTLRMHNILESMFAITQLTQHTSPLETEMVDIGVLVREAAEALAPRLAQRSQVLHIELPALPFVPGDRTLLSKVFFQLIENGIKFTPDGGQLRVEAKLRRPTQDLPTGGLELIFSDTGVGVDPSQREAIFTKFYQSSDVGRHSTSKVRFMGGGTGLGLALCKAVIEAHKGRIWVESPGYDEVHFPGSQFHVLLPLHPPSSGQTIRMGSAVRQKYP
ncbi:MAG: ATP-binding protein [Anaerolineales bacterium]